MLKSFFRKSISILLTLCILCSLFSSACLNISAADTTGVSVDIVSFMRGPQEDLRSSELLEARVTGYHGNVQELTYEWINELGTYLYVYNSHNMYYINNTDGEIEIYNSKVSSSENMVGRSHKDRFEKQGFCWAAVYGAYDSAYNALDGKITVIVKDKDGNELCRDTHTADATRSGFIFYNYTYKGIIPYDIEDDLDDVTIGMFVGDKRNVKDLLGESAILHITCVESDVQSGKIVGNTSPYISLTTENGDYYITGIKAGTSESTSSNGDAQVDLTIKKGNCKFHNDKTGSATTTVFVFEKPVTQTTAYTLTLTDGIDDRCEYFIDGVKGKEVDGKIVFENLTPNTQYMVEVKATYTDENQNTRHAYAYVYDTTKPIYTGTVEVYLNGTYDSATHTATGTKVDIDDVTEYSEICALEENSTTAIPLNWHGENTGTYSNILDEGSYKIYYKDGNSITKIDDQILTMHHADTTRYLFFNSVTYKDGDTELATDYHISDTSVSARADIIPTKEGYVFTGWQDENGNVYKANELITSNISKPYVLTATWVKGIDVYLNIEIDHYAKNGNGHCTESDRHNVEFDIMSKLMDSDGDYTDVFPAPYSISWDGETEFVSHHFNAQHKETDNSEITSYTAKAPVLSNTLPGYDYTVEVAKSGYEIIELSSTTDENGDVTVNVKLRYDPKNSNLNFAVELDDESKALVAQYPEYKPQAVHVKILSWYTSDYGNISANSWAPITQHKDTFVTLNLDENGKATGSYPVWMHNSKGTEHYYYRIKVVSYVLSNGTVVETRDYTDNYQKDVQYISLGERYTATISIENGGNTPDGSSLSGANFHNDEHTQDGTPKATIHINSHTITFDANGGAFSDGTTGKKVVTNQIEVPDLTPYTPTKEGGFVFDGWEVVKGNGVGTTVNTGDELFSDVELKAKWKDPLTVQGIVSVAGYYHLDGDTKTINGPDRTHNVTVYLQRILANGYAETINSQMVNIDYSDLSANSMEKPIGSGNYKFTQVPDDGHEYRVLIQNPNYKDKYQNEPDSLDDNLKFDFSKYNAESPDTRSFMAVFSPEGAPDSNDPHTADVNIFLEFVPTPFPLNYEVNSVAIGEGFRPENAYIAILYNQNINGSQQKWVPISQMTDGDDTVVDEATNINKDGIGKDSYDVWINHSDGHTLYDYSLLLDSYTAAKANNTTDFEASKAPFYAYYNGSARYSSLNGQSSPLTVTLVPKQYKITFDIGFTETETDYVLGMFPYEDENLVYTMQHTWSYDTDISKVAPIRPGHKFLGWYDSDPKTNPDAKKITKIDASVAQNTTVYANWDEAITVTFHSNNPDIDYQIFRTYYEYGFELPDGENLYHLTSENKVSSFYDIPEFKYTTHNGYIFKGWYLDKDSDARPINFETDKYTQSTNIYAHWIKTGTVEKEDTDTKLTEYGKKYPGFDLIGVQIRDIEKDDISHDGTANTGLRFVTVLSEDVYQQINALSNKNASGAEYGYALAKTNTAKNYYENAGKPENYELQYKGANVNGVNTSTDYKYVSNVKCSGYPDHYEGTDYRLYTAVVTFKGDENAVKTAHEAPLLARSYIRYTDANGLFRTHYNNYTGTNVFSGCSASFDDALRLMNPENK